MHAFIGVVRPDAKDNAPIAAVKYDVERDCSLIQEGQKHGTPPDIGVVRKKGSGGDSTAMDRHPSFTLHT